MSRSSLSFGQSLRERIRVQQESRRSVVAATLASACVLVALWIGAGLSLAAGAAAVLLQGVLLFGSTRRLLRPGFHSAPRFGRANQVTMARSSFVAVLLAFALDADSAVEWTLGLALFGVAALVLDGVDGALARRDGTASRFGGWLDQEVDATLIACLSILVWRTGVVGPWILLAGGLRYGFLVLLAVAPRFRAPLPFSQRRRVCCVIQIASLLACLVPFLPLRLKIFVAAFSVAALVASFAIDLVLLWRQSLRTPTSAPVLP
ncbi:CDP-alcohol phosphatidyltransferase [Planctomycetes bacterium Poly30]|uniref:CDP-alcohol phosphatidyltransferase n=2 Tax=Saltatorellus ferox TaxID=2528018 RepID=A0A518EYB5_9BACT|nr:CDP-alcohol phosphatidyltransferase [Planctomycetes bacterium Poly30]